MSENHVAEQAPEVDSDSGPHMGHDESNGVTESNTDTYQDQVPIPNYLYAMEIGIMPSFDF